VAPEFGPGPLPNVPVLLVEGEDDLRTPVENAKRTAALFPRSRLVVAPATGHSTISADFSGCAQRAFARFVQRRPVGPRCRRVRRAFPPQPPPPARLADVRRLRGSSSGIRGRTLAAVKLTLGDVAEDSLTELIFDPRDPDIARGGGLRAGRYRIDSANTLELCGLDFQTRRQRGRLRVRGEAAPHGLLTVRGQRMSGRLGGRRVRGSLNAAAGVVALRAPRQSLSLIPSGKEARSTSPWRAPSSRTDATS
jgi:TAP-like protein